MKRYTDRIRIVLLIWILVGCTGPKVQGGSELAATPSPSQPKAAPSAPTSGAQSPTPDAPSRYEVGSTRPLGDMLSQRAAHTATLLESGQVLIAGGFGQGDNTYRESAELYDPTTERFVLTARMAIGRCCHTATRLADGRLLIAGGFHGQYLQDAELYDPATGKFTPTGSLTVPRMDHVAVLLQDGRVLLAGGVGTGWTFLSSAELYDPSTGTFTPTGGMAVARESHTATRLQDGRVLITGGHRGRHADIVIYDSAETYDPTSGVFAPTGSMGLRRHKHDAVLLSDGKVLITGGSDEHDDQGAYASAEVYDPATGIFRAIGDMPAVRYKHNGTSVLLPSGEVLVAGGARNAVVYDSQGDDFHLVPGDLGTEALSRLFATATLLEDGSVLITGGYGIGQNVTSGAWVYSP